MKLQFLGTAAAEGVPAIFCRCEQCRYVRKHKGKDVRVRSQAVLDGKILIDLPADTYQNLIKYDLDLTEIRDILITHSHMDHLYTGDFEMIKEGFATLPEDYPPLNVYCAEDIPPHFKNWVKRAPDRLNIHVVEPFKPFSAAGYTVTALKAVHGSAEMKPYIYLIEKDGKSLLYANDTDVFPEDTWEYLAKAKPYIAMVSLDCTDGIKEEMTYIGHMCFGKNRICRDRLLNLGLIDGSSKVYINHFSHNSPILYKDLVREGKKEGFIPSYDGLTVEF